MSDDDRVSVGCKVDPEVRREFRLFAARRDETMSGILRDQIHDLLDDADESDLPTEQPAD